MSQGSVLATEAKLPLHDTGIHQSCVKENKWLQSHNQNLQF